MTREKLLHELELLVKEAGKSDEEDVLLSSSIIHVLIGSLYGGCIDELATINGEFAERKIAVLKLIRGI